MPKQLQPIKRGFAGMVLGVIAICFGLAQLGTSADRKTFGHPEVFDGIAIALGLLAILLGLLGLRRKEVPRLCGIAIAAGAIAVASHFGLAGVAVMIALVMLGGLIAWVYEV